VQVAGGQPHDVFQIGAGWGIGGRFSATRSLPRWHPADRCPAEAWPLSLPPYPPDNRSAGLRIVPEASFSTCL